MPQGVKTAATAIWSLVLGIMSLVLCLGPLASIPAVICGHVAQSKIKGAGGTLDGNGMALAGLIMGYINIGLSVLMVPMMVAIAIPSFVKARDTAMQNACINNQRMIDSAKEQWAMEKNVGNGTPVEVDEVNAYIPGGCTPDCPKGGTYEYGVIGELPWCSLPEHSRDE